MPTVTSLEKIKRLKGWYELHLDRAVSFPVNEELILKYLLKAGKELASSEIKSIREQGEYLFLKKKALDMLARRRLSEKEVRRKLRLINKSAAYVDRLIEDLKSHGLVDDLGLAAAVIHTQLIGGSKSKRFIKSKLYQKGVPKAITDESIETELADYDEADAAMKIARKKYKTVENLPRLKAKKRIADFLRGRGFDWDVVNQALAELFRGDD